MESDEAYYARLAEHVRSDEFEIPSDAIIERGSGVAAAARRMFAAAAEAAATPEEKAFLSRFGRISFS